MKRWLIFSLFFIIILNSLVLAAIDTNLSVNELELSEGLASGARFVFNLPAVESVTLSYLVILIALFIFLLLVISSLMRFVPFFEGWKAWAGSVIVVLLISFSGGIRGSAQLFLGFQTNFGRFAQIGFIFLSIILLIIGWGLAQLLKMVRNKVGVEVAQQMGLNLSIKPLMNKLRGS